jgi:hypothetical protein
VNAYKQIVAAARANGWVVTGSTRYPAIIRRGDRAVFAYFSVGGRKMQSADIWLSGGYRDMEIRDASADGVDTVLGILSRYGSRS